MVWTLRHLPRSSRFNEAPVARPEKCHEELPVVPHQEGFNEAPVARPEKLRRGITWSCAGWASMRLRSRDRRNKLFDLTRLKVSTLQ